MRSLRLVMLALGLFGSASAPAAEVAVLNEANWSEFVPRGKEVDAIYGDVVIRNDKLVAVIAQPVDGRNANLTMKNAGGGLIDFTNRAAQNDQLGAYYPLGRAVNWRESTIEPPLVDGRSSATGQVVIVRVSTTLRPDELTAETKYVLADGADYVAVGVTLTNLTDKPLKYAPKDETVVQGSIIKGTSGKLSWTYDRWWDAAYGVLAVEDITAEIELPARGKTTISKKLYLSEDLAKLQHLVDGEGKARGKIRVAKASTDSAPIVRAYVEVLSAGKVVTAGKTNEQGEFVCTFVPDAFFTVSHPAHGRSESQPLIEGKSEVVSNGRVIKNSDDFGFVTLSVPGLVAATITDEAGKPIPCKVQFRGVGETQAPVFFDKTGEHAVGNLYYSHDGRFSLDLPPGTYDVTVSRGPEYDIVEEKLTIRSGQTASLAAKLIRSVQTPGWISADFHNHATPSGDNSSSQLGRVLNLLGEHLEFAPCTEHNRVSSYLPHLQRLKAERWMATCSGIELTGSHLPTNHHNAFPMKLHEHKQDGGGPTVDNEVEVSVERLVLWDDRSPKLIQQNHPDIGQLFFDKNGDGLPDGGFERALGHLDCIEVHPPHLIFAGPTQTSKQSSSGNNRMFNWMQLLNQGHRLPGVVNTDAHYNIHGSGWLRNYVACSTDDPAQIDVAEMVHAAEHGRLIMTNAPYLEVSLKTDSAERRPPGIPGSLVKASGGKVSLHVRVQCANWYDIDRVQVFVNGRPDPKLNFTRAANPDAFSAQTLKFDREIPLELTGDVHLIVAAIGEHSGLGYVMGPEHADDRPTAVSNPIFVDVDGGGFQANKDTLGVPLPVKDPKSK